MSKLYLLGGAGQIASRYLPSTLPAWMKDVTIEAIDTSSSETTLLNKDIDINIHKLTEGGSDGSGGVRGASIEMVRRELPKYLLEHPIDDTNILVFNSSGASGSIIAMVLLDHILKAGKKAIVLTSYTDHNMQRAAMSYRQLKSINNIASINKSTITGAIYNGAKVGYAEVDSQIAKDILTLTYFTNAEIPGVDVSDLEIFLSPEKIPDLNIPTGFYSLKVIKGAVYPESMPIPLAALTLSDIGGTDDIGSRAAITYSGVIDKETYNNFSSEEGTEPCLSLCIDNSTNIAGLSALADKIDQYKDVADSALLVRAATAPSKIDIGDGGDDDGMII